MQRTIEERRCDSCGKVVEQDAPRFGGSPFNGWLHVIRTDCSTQIKRTALSPWDFCSPECCISFVKTLVG
jgi:hypothetical protein